MEQKLKPPPGPMAEQRGWVVAALVVFLGVAYTGPALARFNAKQKLARRRVAEKVSRTRDRVADAGIRAQRKLHRLGGGSIRR